MDDDFRVAEILAIIDSHQNEVVNALGNHTKKAQSVGEGQKKWMDANAPTTLETLICAVNILGTLYKHYQEILDEDPIPGTDPDNNEDYARAMVQGVVQAAFRIVDNNEIDKALTRELSSILGLSRGDA